MCRTEKTVEQRAARDEEEGEDGEEVAYADVDGARQGEGCVGEEGDDERQKFYLPANEEPPHGPRERRDRDEQERQAGLEREGDGGRQGDERRRQQHREFRDERDAAGEPQRARSLARGRARVGVEGEERE